MLAIVKTSGPNGAGDKYEINSLNGLANIFKEIFELMEFDDEQWSLVVIKAHSKPFGAAMKDKCVEQFKLLFSGQEPENPGYFVSMNYAADIYGSLLEEDQKYVQTKLANYFKNRNNAE
jgi:hypothetical protein